MCALWFAAYGDQTMPLSCPSISPLREAGSYRCPDIGKADTKQVSGRDMMLAAQSVYHNNQLRAVGGGAGDGRTPDAQRRQQQLKQYNRDADGPDLRFAAQPRIAHRRGAAGKDVFCADHKYAEQLNLGWPDGAFEGFAEHERNGQRQNRTEGQHNQPTE